MIDNYDNYNDYYNSLRILINRHINSMCFIYFVIWYWISFLYTYSIIYSQISSRFRLYRREKLYLKKLGIFARSSISVCVGVYTWYISISRRFVCLFDKKSFYPISNYWIETICLNYTNITIEVKQPYRLRNEIPTKSSQKAKSFVK